MRVVRFDEVAPSKQQRDAFDCGEPSLNRWLATQAGQSMRSRDAVTHLLLQGRGNGDDEAIVGYYCLAAGQVTRSEAPKSMARSAPDPIPAVRMGRFAIDRSIQGKGWGAELLAHALLGAVTVSELIAARVFLVDAISAEALAFYFRFGFERSPIHPMQVMKDLRVVAASAGLSAHPDLPK